MNISEKVNWIKKQVEEAGAEGVAIEIDGTLQSAVCAALGKKAFPNDFFSFFVGINNERETKRNYLRITESLGLNIVHIDLTEIYENYIKEVFEIANPYQSPEVFEHYHKTGEAPVDKSYLESDKINLIRSDIKETLVELAVESQATKRNYLVLNYDKFLNEEDKEDMINLALELGVNENVVNIIKGEWNE